MSDAFCRAVRPPTDLQVADWCAENVFIVGSERATKFDIGQFPWWRFPMELIRNHEVQEVFCVMPTGSGKSTMAEALFCYITSEEPGNLLYASQANDKAKFWAESRLLPALRKCRSLESLWPEDRHSSRKTEIIWPHMAMQFVGANLTNFQECSVRFNYGDEFWRWDDGLIKEMLNRHHERWNRKAYFVSQGGFVGSEGHRKCLESTEYVYRWPCRECGNFHDWDMANLKYDVVIKDGHIDRVSTTETARIECPTCGARHEDKIQDRRSLCDASEFILEKIGNNPKQVYLHGVTRLTMWWVGYGEVVGRILDAKAALAKGIIDPWRQLHQKDFALFWDDNFVQEKKEIAIGDHQKELLSIDLVDDEKCRIMTVDCGKNHFWHVLAAWSNDGKCRILSEGYVDSEAKLKSIADQAGCKSVYVDVGWDNENKDVLSMIDRNSWIGIRGSDKMEFSHRSKEGKAIAKPYSPYGRVMTKEKRIVQYFFVSSKKFKDDADGLLNAGQIELPVDVSNNFRSHLQAEVRTITKDSKGNETHFWKQINRNNHLWDCLYYNVAVAYIKGVFRE